MKMFSRITSQLNQPTFCAPLASFSVAMSSSNPFSFSSSSCAFPSAFLLSSAAFCASSLARALSSCRWSMVLENFSCWASGKAPENCLRRAWMVWRRCLARWCPSCLACHSVCCWASSCCSTLSFCASSFCRRVLAASSRLIAVVSLNWRATMCWWSLAIRAFSSDWAWRGDVHLVAWWKGCTAEKRKTYLVVQHLSPQAFYFLLSRLLSGLQSGHLHFSDIWHLPQSANI